MATKSMATKRAFWALVAALAMMAVRTGPGTALADERLVIGIPALGETALEFIGRSDQDGPMVTHYGYFTYVSGLLQNALFSDPNTRTEATARFTFFGTTTLNARHELGNIITTAAPGTLTIYFNKAPGGSFSDPESFAKGEPIATFSLHYHNVLNVQAPDHGITSAIADLDQLTATQFSFDGRQHRLGRKGLRERIDASGQGTRTQVNPVQAFFLTGGTIVLTDR